MAVTTNSSVTVNADDRCGDLNGQGALTHEPVPARRDALKKKTCF